MADTDNREKSFSRKVKGEIYKIQPVDRCCIKARFIGLILFGAGTIAKNEIKLVTNNPDVLGSFVELSRKLGLTAEAVQNSDKSEKYTAVLHDNVKIAQLLYDLKLLDEDGNIALSGESIKRTCCKREFLRGAFLGSGVLSDPEKNYSLEFSASSRELCGELIQIFADAGFDFHLTKRRSKYVAYLKSSEAIADALTYLGAYKSQMELLNVVIEKEVRNDVNRNANGETSNLSRTINASVEQIRAIYKIEKSDGLDSLPDDLREIACLRLKYKDISLTELGARLNPPLTKSGVNHRMQKIMRRAEKLK